MIDVDFIEIGTSNFDTLIEKATNEYGFSIEPIRHYIDQLPNKPNVKKVCEAITGEAPPGATVDVYYIPEETIKQRRIFNWFKGCNCIGAFHPLHIKYGLMTLVEIDSVPLIGIGDFLQQNNIRGVKYLKIDTEGHDVIILRGLLKYMLNKSDEFYPGRILFESNANIPVEEVDEIIVAFEKIGYKLISREHDTVIEYTKKNDNF